MATPLEPVPACTRILQALQERAPDITPEAMAERLAGWSFLDCGGAVVMMHGDEVHVAAPPERRGRWLTRGDIKQVLGGILQRFGRVRTSVMRDNLAGHWFVSRLGFREVKITAEATFYELGGSAC